MDLQLVMAELRPGENVSPDLSSYESMAATWRGSGTCPTKAICQAKWNEIKTAIEAKRIDTKRRDEYSKRGADVASVVEALIEAFAESRPEKLDAIMAIRSQVKQDIPKP